MSSVESIVHHIYEQRRVPRATYRLQFNRHFTFEDAAAIVPYLHELGISDCYASPILRARAESLHGYDICDHGQLNPALGGEAAFDRFSAALQERGLGLMLDMVPNHMGIGETCNTWWMDVLENGPSSIYASYFDIDWHPVKPELANKVLLPILGEQYGTVLENGEIHLEYQDGAFFVCYYENTLPVAPDTYGRILGHRLDTLAETLGEFDERVLELKSIITALSYLPASSETDPQRRVERNREKEVIKRRVAALYDSNDELREAIEASVQELSGTTDDLTSFNALDELLAAQTYRLAFWRVAAEEINYRRFFDVNDLTAIRVEVPEVFAATHELTFRLLAEGKATGLRIDHPDGLWDPTGYFRQLQEQYVLHRVRAELLHNSLLPNEIEVLMEEVRAAVQSPARWRSNAPYARPLYIVAEKILSEREPLPRDWLVDGTTGYDFLNQVNGLFVDSRHRRAFDAIYSQFINREISLNELIYESKRLIMDLALASEVNSISHLLERISEKNRRYRDFTLNGLTDAIQEVIAALPVYRTYVNAEAGSVSAKDGRDVEAAIAEAKRRNPGMNASIFDFIRDTLLLRNLHTFAEEDRATLYTFVMKFQQITGPMTAKGIEDTAFYSYNRLVSLNEVGSDPSQFGVSVAQFHRQNARRLADWPHAMLSTSTHDTKRSEDARARLDVLSELPREWRAALERWSKLNADKKVQINDTLAPDRNDEYLLYQTLLCAWPFATDGEGDLVLSPDSSSFGAFCERIVAYMRKATKEAKVHTGWLNANEVYDVAVESFTRAVLSCEGGSNLFLEDMLPLARRAAYYGQFNSLAQQLLKLTVPGVPDMYQGTELWDLSLVDPDNRRPVDYAQREAMLRDLKAQIAADDADLAALTEELLASGADGRVKLYITHQALAFRRDHQQLFEDGEYVPLEATGLRRANICAFMRTLNDTSVTVVAPRLGLQLTGGSEQPPVGEAVWGDTWLHLPHARAGQRYRNVLTGETFAVGRRSNRRGLQLAQIFGRFPFALLERV